MQKAEFLKTYKKYQLGNLPTEQQHPKTRGLSALARTDLSAAIATLKQVDLEALHKVKGATDRIEDLRAAVQRVLNSDGRIFLCGCGATGRLSLLSEFLYREKYANDKVISFMAGGDVALVHSLEGFEDYPDLGERHLMQMGFTEHDLLIASTEGGETPFVIGATEAAARISKHSPFYLYCNPDVVLMEQVERSKQVLQNSAIEKIELFVGPMGLSGSTRMQASTVLQLAVGMALVETDQPVATLLQEFIDEVERTDFLALAPFIKKEVAIYEAGEHVMYMPRDFAITVFTDTTERSPTFSLPSFENNLYTGARPSLCYILIPSANDASEAWRQLLLRDPHALEWGAIDPQTTSHYLDSFDFSKNSLELREARLNNKRQYLFEIQLRGEQLAVSLAGIEHEWSLSTKRSLFRHTLLKLLLNIHSTLLMGLMGRYESNIMTWVTATNGKLIDRATRYVQILLHERNIQVDYLDIVERVYQLKENLSSSDCIVMKVLESFEDSQKGMKANEY